MNWLHPEKKLDAFNSWGKTSLLLLIFALSSCNEENVDDLGTPKTPAVPTVKNISIDILNWNSVSLRGFISDTGGSQLAEIGFVWSTSPNPTVVLSTKVSENTGIGYFTSIEFARTANGLSPDTKYYARAYATNSVGTGYSIEIAFVTLPPGAPQGIITYLVKSISSSSAVGSGQVGSDHGGPIIAIGTVWGTSPSPDVSLSTKTVDGTDVGNFTSNITGLLTKTRYYFRSYATNSYGTSYGQELNFVTPDANILTVATNDIKVVKIAVGPFPWDPPGTQPLYTYLINGAGGNIQDDGGSLVIERGLEWRYESNSYSIVGRTSDGAGAGEFASNIDPQLTTETSYYVRAYATNSSGTAYGQYVYVFIPKN